MTRWVPLAAVAALLGAAMLAALFANPTIEALPLPTNQALHSAPNRLPPEQQDPVAVDSSAAGKTLDMPPWTIPLGVVLGLGVVLVLLILLLLGLFRLRVRFREVGVRLAPAERVIATQRQVRQAVAEGLAELDDSDSDPRTVVIACWARLERAAAEAGTPREPGDTSTDLVARLLAGHQVSAAVLDAFAAVYREARFATHTVDAGMRDQARAALRQVRDELAAPAVAPAVTET